MSGFALAVGRCISCGRTFGFNPGKVPSVRVAGQREPVCESCMTAANAVRVSRGLPELPVLPGAYEPSPEEDLPC